MVCSPQKSITFLVPALNEEDHIESTVKTIILAVHSFNCDYEIILISDGSTDKTPQIMDKLGQSNSKIRVLHNSTNLGLGGTYKKGVQYAEKEFVMLVSGDNAETSENLSNIITHIGEADIIIPWLQANKTRPWFRRFTSACFTRIINFLFGLKVHYYNGSVVHRTKSIQKISIRTNSFAYQAEALVKLLHQDSSYLEIPYSSASYDGLFSYAMRPKNLIAVFKAISLLFIEVYFQKLNHLNCRIRNNEMSS